MTQTMRDLTNDDLWRLSTDINEFNQDGGHITVMRFVLVGPQSAGKTSVIERVTGHSVGYTASGTGTRAPVVYRCTKSPDALSITLAIASVGGHDNESWPSTLHFFDDNLRYKCHDYHDLTDKMQMIMNSIKQDTNDGFSSREIVVTIESPDSPNVEFVDLPGFVSKPSNDAVEQLQKHINSAKLIREYARHSDHFILFCAPAAIQTESDNDFSTIFQLVRETRELKPGVDFMTLCTKADQGRFMDEISGADADPRNMSQVIAERHAVFFSVYPSSKEWNECFFERKREFETGYKDGYLQQFGIKDQDRVLLGVVRARATHWEEQWNRHFGFSQFLAKYDRLWKENFVKGLNKSRAQLREQVEALQAPFDDLLQLRGLNDEYVRREMDDYSRAFCNHFFAAFNGKRTSMGFSNIPRRPVEPSKLGHWHDKLGSSSTHFYDPEDSGKTFFELQSVLENLEQEKDLNWVSDLSGHFAFRNEAICGWLSDVLGHEAQQHRDPAKYRFSQRTPGLHHPRTEASLGLKHRFLGLSAFKTIFHVYQYLFIATPLPMPNDNKIRHLLLSQGGMSTLAADEAIRQIVAGDVQEMASGAPTFFAMALASVMDLADRVHDHLGKSRFGAGFSQMARMYINRELYSFTLNKIKSLHQMWQSTVAEYVAHSDLGMINRLIGLVLIAAQARQSPFPLLRSDTVNTAHAEPEQEMLESFSKSAEKLSQALSGNEPITQTTQEVACLVGEAASIIFFDDVKAPSRRNSPSQRAVPSLNGSQQEQFDKVTKEYDQQVVPVINFITEILRALNKRPDLLDIAQPINQTFQHAYGSLDHSQLADVAYSESVTARFLMMIRFSHGAARFSTDFCNSESDFFKRISHKFTELGPDAFVPRDGILEAKCQSNLLRAKNGHKLLAKMSGHPPNKLPPLPPAIVFFEQQVAPTLKRDHPRSTADVEAKEPSPATTTVSNQSSPTTSATTPSPPLPQPRPEDRIYPELDSTLFAPWSPPTAPPPPHAPHHEDAVEANLRMQITEKDQKIEGLEIELDVRDKQILDLQARLDRKNKQIQSLQSGKGQEEKEKDARIFDLEADLVEATKTINTQQKKLAKLDELSKDPKGKKLLKKFESERFGSESN